MADSTTPSTANTTDDKVADAAVTKSTATKTTAPKTTAAKAAAKTDTKVDDALVSKTGLDETSKDAEPEGGLKADPGPVTDAIAGHAPLPDPLEQRDAIRDSDDAQTASAGRAEADPDVNTDMAAYGYQISQFDESGGRGVLDSLAFPPKAAVRAAEVAEAQIDQSQGLVTDGTAVSAPVTDDDDHDLKEAERSEVVKDEGTVKTADSDLAKTPASDDSTVKVAGTNQEQVVRSDGTKTTDTK